MTMFFQEPFSKKKILFNANDSLHSVSLSTKSQSYGTWPYLIYYMKLDYIIGTGLHLQFSDCICIHMLWLDDSDSQQLNRHSGILNSFAWLCQCHHRLWRMMFAIFQYTKCIWPNKWVRNKRQQIEWNPGK